MKLANQSLSIQISMHFSQEEPRLGELLPVPLRQCSKIKSGIRRENSSIILDDADLSIAIPGVRAGF